MQLKNVDYDAPFVHQRTIRFGETDAASIVYTVRFFDYALDAIDAWYADVLTVSLYSLNTEHGLSCPFVHAGIDFQSALRPSDRLSVTVLVQALGRSSLTFRILGAQADGTPSFSGTFTVVFVDGASMRSIPVPEPLAERIREYQARCPAGDAPGGGRGALAGSVAP